MLFKQDVLRTSAQTSCDIEVADGLYSMGVGYGEAVSTTYIYVNNGTAISVDVPAYDLNHKPTNEVPDCTDDLVVKAFNMVNNCMYVQPYSCSLANTLEDMQLPDDTLSASQFIKEHYYEIS